MFKKKKTQIDYSNPENTMKTNLTVGQRDKIRRTVNNEMETTLQIKYEQFDEDPGMNLNSTQRPVGKLKGSNPGRSVRITFSKTQLSTMKEVVVAPLSVRKPKTKADKDIVEKMVELSLTPGDAKIKRVQFNDIPVIHEFEGHNIFGRIAKLAIPFIKNTLLRVLETLGLAAATGAFSGAAHKKTGDRGLKRADGSIKVTKKQLEDLMELAYFMHEYKFVKSNFVDMMDRYLKKQSGGFIGELLSSLAASFIPSLISGNGLKSAE